MLFVLNSINSCLPIIFWYSNPQSTIPRQTQCVGLHVCTDEQKTNPTLQTIFNLLKVGVGVEGEYFDFVTSITDCAGLAFLLKSSVFPQMSVKKTKLSN